METWQLAVIIGGILVALFVFLIALTRAAVGAHDPHSPNNPTLKKAQTDVEHVFDDEFREELRNRGRLYFEKVLSENAMFLEQDLRLTTLQLNEYIKDEVTSKLKQELSKYEHSITDATEMALGSLTKTQEALEEQRQVVGKQLLQEYKQEKARLIGYFQENLADIVNHYVLAAIGDHVDLSDQIDFILADLEANKEAILEDISDE